MLAWGWFLAEEAEQFGLVLYEQVDDAAQPAELCFDLIEPSVQSFLDGGKAELDLLDIAPD